MNAKNLLRAGLFGLTMATALGGSAGADVLRVVQGERSGTISVPMNRAVVVESDVPFAELSIANPGIADISTLSASTIYVLGKEPGRTTLTLLGADGRLISNVDVHVAPDIAEFKERLQQILPGERIEVRTANDGIVLSGTVSSIGKLDRAMQLAERYAPDNVSNLMSVGGTQQVMLKVRFAEMRRSVTKGLGVSLGANASNPFLLGGQNQLSNLGEYQEYLTGEGDGLQPSGTATGRYLLGFNVGGVGFDILIEALESKGVVRTLAEPNLTALSGQEASFLAGGEYPIPVPGENGNISIEYKPFGVELAFTPTVLDDGIINLNIDAAVSAIDTTVNVQSEGFSVSGFSRRESSTTVEMRDGESFAIAGLLQDDFNDVKGQVPWLGDVPILGALFRSAEYSRNQSELVIIVTPYLVTPTQGEALALPTDRIQLPSEREFFLNGSMVSARTPRSGAAGEVAKQDFGGSYGYMMD